MRRRDLALIVAAALACVNPAPAAPWPQFHGPNASGRAADDAPLPDQVGRDRNVIWTAALPPGHSSPAVFGDRVYVTAERGNQLLTIALDAATGKTAWEAEAPHKGLEPIHKIGSHAQPSPATDGRYVVSLFGSCGLFCYHRDGKLAWHLPLGPFKNDFGAGSSPIIVDGRVVLNQDHDTDSFLAAFDLPTGKLVWKADRSEFPRGYATPVVWEVGGKKQVVVSGTLRVAGYDFETGKEIWTVRGLARIVNMTPFVGPDNTLYVPAWAPGGDDNDRIDVPPFAEMIRQHDANKNGTLEIEEVPTGPLKQRFTQIDRDKDGHITRAEYEEMRQIFDNARNLIVAIKPGGTGDVTRTHVLWSYKKGLPYVPSPVYYRGHIFMVKNGSIVTCLDAKTGKPTKQDRVSGGDSYFSSPVEGDGKIYLLSEHGDLSVISAEPQWKVLSRAKLGEDAYATPAIADGRVYVRTSGHLYCFGLEGGRGQKAVSRGR